MLSTLGKIKGCCQLKVKVGFGAEQSLSFAIVHPEGQHPSELMQEVIVLCEHDELHVPGLLQMSVVHGFVSAHCALFEQVGVMQEPEQQIPVAQPQSAGQVEQFSVASQTSSPHIAPTTGQLSFGISIHTPQSPFILQVFVPAQNTPGGFTYTLHGSVSP